MDIEIRKREMGIILQHQMKEGVKIKRSIYTKLVHEESYCLVDCPPIFPDFAVPDLERLVFRKEDDDLDETRFKLFQWVFNYAFVAKDLLKLQREFIPLLTALAFLVQEFDMTVEMADIFTCAYYDGFVDRVPNDLATPTVVIPAAFRGIYAFVKMYTAAFRVLKVVGLKAFVEPTIFDGKYFHVLYSQWQNMEPEEKQRKLEEIKDFRPIYTKKAENWW